MDGGGPACKRAVIVLAGLAACLARNTAASDTFTQGSPDCLFKAAR